MATWLKPTWWPGDYDRATDAFTHGAIPPGIYCEDEASFEALAKHPDVTRPHGAFRQSCSDPEGRWWPAIYVGGYLVRIGTPAQIEILKAVEAKSPDEVLAEQQAALDRAAAEIDSLIANMAPKPAPRPAAPPPATRHPFSGANRQQRRAAEARARRRA